MWLVSVYGELKRLSERTLSQAGLLSRATASNSCREDIGLTKLSPDSTLYRKVAERRGILLPAYLKSNEIFNASKSICEVSPFPSNLKQIPLVFVIESTRKYWSFL